MASGQNNSLDQRILQCLVMMIQEQKALKEGLSKFATEMGHFRENMYQEFERLQDSVDSINRKMSSGKKCVCGGSGAVGTRHSPNTKPSTKSKPRFHN